MGNTEFVRSNVLKKCPFCAEEIQNQAIYCRYCRKYLESRERQKWYLKTSVVVIALLSFGPFALPLVWFHPRYSRMVKCVVSLVVAGLTFLIIIAAMQVAGPLASHYKEMMKMLEVQ